MLMDMLGDDGTVLFEGYGDLSVSELLSVILPAYSETDMTVVAPSLPDHAAKALCYWMKKKWATVDGRLADVIGRLTVVANLSERRSPAASGWTACNPFPGRLVTRSVHQNDTAIILPDLAIYGPVNMTYGGHFTASVTRDAGIIGELRDTYARLCP